MFYNKQINIYAYKEYEEEVRPGIFVDREGYKKVNDKPIDADVQPYSSEQAEKDYGYKIECVRRLFCDIIPDLQEDSLIEYNNKFYKIKKIPWDDQFYEILLDETKDYKVV